MKKLPLLLAAFCFLITLHAQQFSFQINFVDAAGSKDSIVLGYDPSATDTIDTAWGETNILGTPLHAGLDVRISNEWEHRSHMNTPGTFHTRKQITSGDCPLSDTPARQVIDIHTHHWPVTATWDNSLFQADCRNGSFFTSINPGGWWDTGSPSDLDFQEFITNHSVTFTSNESSSFLNPAYSYLNDSGDTISVFWQMFGPEGFVASIVDSSYCNCDFHVFPNPASSQIHILTPPGFGKTQSIEIYSLPGQIVLVRDGNPEVNLSSLANGAYFLKATNNRGHKLWTRFVKTQ